MHDQARTGVDSPPRAGAASGASRFLAAQMIEWPEGETEPDYYWLAALPADISLERMVDQAKLRWRIERDYLELKQEVGLGHYEGRGWRGFHPFLISEKETIPPQDRPAPGEGRNLPFPMVIDPEGSAAAFATPRAARNRNVAYPPRAGSGACTAAMSLLRTQASERSRAECVTQ